MFEENIFQNLNENAFIWKKLCEKHDDKSVNLNLKNVIKFFWSWFLLRKTFFFEIRHLNRN